MDDIIMDNSKGSDNISQAEKKGGANSSNLNVQVPQQQESTLDNEMVKSGKMESPAIKLKSFFARDKRS